jgi:hypothetical protein
MERTHPACGSRASCLRPVCLLDVSSALRAMERRHRFLPSAYCRLLTAIRFLPSVRCNLCNLWILFLKPETRNCILAIRGAVAQFGRAPRSQCGGQGFEPPLLHQLFSTTNSHRQLWLFWPKACSYPHCRVRLAVGPSWNERTQLILITPYVPGPGEVRIRPKSAASAST